LNSTPKDIITLKQIKYCNIYIYIEREREREREREIWCNIGYHCTGTRECLW
jgi:hypothetical protein